jgi:Asp-tRNA(Asn)/Glu-tRNA(Gln) amidotransferase A subunit family amidase
VIYAASSEAKNGAAAVADGLLPFAEGTDGGGSIRIPSSCCNVYGYKASFGRVPCLVRPNAFGADTPFIFEGPITRNVEDAALALDALSGYIRWYHAELHLVDKRIVGHKPRSTAWIHKPTAGASAGTARPACGLPPS